MKYSLLNKKQNRESNLKHPISKNSYILIKPKINNSNKETKNNIEEINSQIKPRQENSLGELTKNFINYIRKSGKNTVNINELVKELKVKKRRIYDITNVLEGKNNIN